MLRASTRLCADLVLWTLATALAYVIRLDGGLEPPYVVGMVLMAIAMLPAKGAFIWMFGLHRRSFHTVGVRDLAALGVGITFVLVLSYTLRAFLPASVVVPRSVPFIEAMVAMLLLGGARLMVRLVSEQGQRRGVRGAKRRVLIVGAGEAGTILAREMLRHPRAGLIPVGFLDDNVGKRRERFFGVPVLGPLNALRRIAEAHGVDEILIAMPSVTGDIVRRVVEEARSAHLTHRIIPGIYELLSGHVSISEIREVNVEDLLRRTPVELELDEISTYLTGRRVLVTGAGGSIGAEIVRQVARFNPDFIVLVGRGEHSIFGIEEEMRRIFPGVSVHAVICDVRDRVKLSAVFKRFRPQVVFHAAAHKHVPLMEANPDQAIFNNVIGTRNMAEIALAYGVVRFVNVSTDKAVNPTSVMGASKRVAEQVVGLAAQRAKAAQQFVSVRFGNVLGSRGSVVLSFQAQIARGGPVTITHPDMKRYFMTIPEAAQLVLQAGGMAANGTVYVLDMGEPVRIVDLARDLILLSGLEPNQDIEIAFSGMRPGEKLFEELLTAEEGTDTSRHQKIFVARKSEVDAEALEANLVHLVEAATSCDDVRIRKVLKQLVPSASFELLGHPPPARADAFPYTTGDGGTGAPVSPNQPARGIVEP